MFLFANLWAYYLMGVTLTSFCNLMRGGQILWNLPKVCGIVGLLNWLVYVKLRPVGRLLDEREYYLTSSSKDVFLCESPG